MSTTAARGAILVAVDGSPCAKAAVDWAARAAAQRNIPLRLVHVVTPGMVVWPELAVPPGYAQWEEELAAEVTKSAAEVAEKAAPGVQVHTEQIDGPSVTTLIDLSKEASMIVVGSHGRGGLARALVGSVSSSLVRHAHCPVAVIRDEEIPAQTPAHAPVVVGIDGSPASEKATAIAFDEASWRKVDLVAVHAVSDSDLVEVPRADWDSLEQRGGEVLAERLAGWQERYPDVHVTRVVQWSRPASAIVEAAEKAQLVVVGSHGRGGFAGMLLGSVASSVVQATPVPVIVARAG